MPNNSVQILLVEDDDVDVAAMRRSLRQHKVSNPLAVANDGLQALAMLRGDEGYTRIKQPLVILLDLNLPRMGGLEFLEELRRDVELGDSVVFVLTTSDDDQDKASAYAHQVAGYLVKSKVGQDFVHLMSVLDSYWRLVELPPEKYRVGK